MFSVVVDSRRGRLQVSELDKFRRKLGVGRVSLGSLSESVRLLDPEPQKRIAEELAHELPEPGASKFDSIDQTITAVDDSVINTAVNVARPAWLPKFRRPGPGICTLLFTLCVAKVGRRNRIVRA